MNRTFLLDDLRTHIPADVICRTASAAFSTLGGATFDVYYFDHDLGSVKPGTTGYDVLKWALENRLIPIGAIVILVSQNPVGKQNMINQLTTYGFTRQGQHFIRRV